MPLPNVPPVGEGGDRYAGRKAMIAIIRTALEASLRDYEIRRYFKMEPDEVITEARRRRMARHKAMRVWQGIVSGVKEGLMIGGAVHLPGFMTLEKKVYTLPTGDLIPHGTLLPIGEYGELVSRASLKTREIKAEHVDGNYRGGLLPLVDGCIKDALGWARMYNQEVNYTSPLPAPADPVTGIRGYSFEGTFLATPQNKLRLTTWIDGAQTYARTVDIPCWLLVKGKTFDPTNGGEILEVTSQDFPLWGVFSDYLWATPATWVAKERYTPPSWGSGVSELGWGPAEMWRNCYPRRDTVYWKNYSFTPPGWGEVEWLTAHEWWKKYGAGVADYAEYDLAIPPRPGPYGGRRGLRVRFDERLASAIALAGSGNPEL